MSRILLRAGRSPLEALSATASIDYVPGGTFAGNIGNMMFSGAVDRILSTTDAEVVPNTYLGERKGVTQVYLDRVNAEFDHFVIPLANAFRPSFAYRLETLARTIEGLKIPTTVVGVGVGGNVASLARGLDTASDELKRIVRRFMHAVLDRSAKVGVRGAETRHFLRALGYGDEHVQVIGCPSLFRYGAGLRVSKLTAHLRADDPIAITITPTIEEMQECSTRHASAYPRLVYIPQDIATLRVLLSGTNPKQFDPRMPTHTGHPFYRENRMISFTDSPSWIAFMRTLRFCFGTRIHGNFAAIVAETPAVVLVHDTRTLELVEYFQVPYRYVSEAAHLEAADLYADADFTAFNSGHAGRFESFLGFLHENGLQTIFDPGKENPEYDRRLAALPSALPLRPRGGARRKAGPKEWMRRTLWRKSYRFSAAVPHVPSSILGVVGSTMARKLLPGSERPDTG